MTFYFVFAQGGATAAPEAISDLATVPGDGEIDLTWSAPTSASPITGYDIERSTTSSSTGFSALETDLAPTTSYTDSTAANGTQYWYRVRAKSAGGVADWSNVPDGQAPMLFQSDLVLWLDASKDDTARNLAADQTVTATINGPVSTTVASRSVWAPDGVDDYIETDYTPTTTATSGPLTVVIIGVHDVADAASGNFVRAFSSESAGSDGLNLAYDETAVAGLYATVGGDSDSASRFGRPYTGVALQHDQPFVAAVRTTSAGEISVYHQDTGATETTTASSVGTITHAPLRFFRPADNSIADRASASPQQAMLVFERDLTNTDLDTICDMYGVQRFVPTEGEFRTQKDLVAPDEPPHILTQLRHAEHSKTTRAQLDGILDEWVTSTGGTTHNVTSEGTWDSAVAAAVPGDLIRVTSSFTADLNLRGNRYSISGHNLTASPAGGTALLPIIATCADGVAVTGTSLTSNEGVLDVQNCVHVWTVGFNTIGGQFGIRHMNWGGTSVAPAYCAFPNVDTPRDAAVAYQGWFQLISTSGGTAPAGDGNEWGFSSFFVTDEPTITDPNPGDVVGNPGEGVYHGRGAAPGWVSYASDFHLRGGSVSNYKGNGFETKPGCRRGKLHDVALVAGRGSNGAPAELCYQFSGIDARPVYMPDDVEIQVEAIRIYDYNITETGTTRNQMVIIGMAGVRVANVMAWSARDSSGNFGPSDDIRGVLIQTEKDAADFGDATTVETFYVNSNFQARGVINMGAADGAITGVIARNNIVPTGYDGGQITAGSGEYAGSTPAVGTLSTADDGEGPGSAFDLDPGSSLVDAGTSIADLTLIFPDRDIMNRLYSVSSPSYGPFQP